MKALMLLLSAFVASSVSAADKPDTFAMLKQAKLTFVKKIENLGTGAVTYRIDFCNEGSCDRFDGAGDKLQIFADYAYLFVVYSGHYDTYKAPTSTAIKSDRDLSNPLVTDAKEKGYAQAVLDHYRDQYHCPQGENERKCVMHVLFKTAQVQRYSVSDSDYYDSYTTVDEDGKPFDHPSP